MLQLLERALALLGQILGIAQVIRDLLGDVSREHLPYQTATNTTNTQLAVQHPTYGLSAIHSDLAALATALADVPTNINTIIASINLLSSQVGSPVQTTAAPSWYGASPSASTIASAVWQYGMSVREVSSGAWNTEQAQTVFSWLHYHAMWTDAFLGLPLATLPYYRVVVSIPEQWMAQIGSWDSPSDFESSLPALDFTTVVPGDTVYTWLTREYPDTDWTLDGPNGATDGHRVWVLPDGVNAYEAVYVDILDWQLSLLNASLTGPATPPPVTVDIPPAAPIWPGASGVTLGDPVALTSNLTLTEALDGVIVTITTPPTRTGQYLLGARTLYYGMGRVAFIDDSGHAEQWQYLSWASEIITPKTMAHASGAVFQVLGGAEGTVTPWVVSEGA